MTDWSTGGFRAHDRASEPSSVRGRSSACVRACLKPAQSWPHNTNELLTPLLTQNKKLLALALALSCKK